MEGNLEKGGSRKKEKGLALPLSGHVWLTNLGLKGISYSSGMDKDIGKGNTSFLSVLLPSKG